MSYLIQWYQNFDKNFKREITISFDETIFSKQSAIKRLKRRNLTQKYIADLANSVQNSNYSLVQKYLEDGADINMSNPDTERKLAHIACFTGDIQMCRLLDQFGANWESLDQDQQTPIYMAINGNSLKVVKFLVEEKNVNHEHVEYQNRTPFYLACFLGYIDIVKYLYSLGVNINQVSKLERCSLSKAAYLGHTEIVRFLLQQKEIIIDLPDCKGRTALHNAAWGKEGGRFGKMTGIGLKDNLEQKQSIRYRGVKLPDSPESCILLIKHGHNVNYQDHEGITPLQSACSSDARDSLKILMENGAELNHQNKNLETSLFLASYYDHLEIVKILIENYKSDIKLKNNKVNEQNIFGVDIEYHIEKEQKYIRNNSICKNLTCEIGFICTIQLSTLNQDIVIDCMKFHSNEITQYLKPFFESQENVFLFHGSENDIKWLLQNFQIQVSNLYDTNKAEQIIVNQNNQNEQIKISHSLANLSQKYLRLKLNKEYQVSDWRIRPLPKPMLDYARMDSRVLIPILLKQYPLIYKKNYNQIQKLNNKIKEKGLKSQVVNNLQIKLVQIH
ncbi:Ribonuclease H-like domain [Pseudocohnilembus persalinus]|uniref:Ribonuclease H-like domain n=1 Tax=Pseudocohnilembus persalinus TaxID=266149 RepID=A0A0V0R7F7_PSEPJ|nr:Ribonuclease H-like domain [Pseudocohnilembus persalinus]|eukprot:KRX10288.1 Ribonuclease H-like domain [Pseudocohnilembus persalinus]